MNIHPFHQRSERVHSFGLKHVAGASIEAPIVDAGISKRSRAGLCLVTTMLLLMLAAPFLMAAPVHAQQQSGSTMTANAEIYHQNPALRYQPLSQLQENIEKLNKVISIRLNEVTMVAALKEVSEKAGLKVIYGDRPELRENRVSLILQEITVLSAFHEIIRGTNLGFKLSPSGHIIVVEQDAPAPVALEQSALAAIDHNVQGQIIQEDGAPLPGANVSIKGTTIGTITNLNGEFALIAPNPTDTLVVSFVGYVTREVPINGNSIVNITLAVSTEALDELVVIGYGEKSRALLTESIGTIDAKQISQLPVVAPDQALQGRISGVQVTSVDGTPGSPVAVRIRGVGTVGNTQPLFVIDGVPVGRGSSSISNPLANINPSDIESISVLKDASAAAVYGVRAANGVVLVTTKRGARGKPTVNFDSYFGVQQLPSLWETNTTSEYIALTQEAYNAFNAQNGLAAGDDSFLELHPDLVSSQYTSINNNQAWMDHATNDNAPIQNYNLSVSGANEQLNYFVSGGYFEQDAVVNKWNLNRYTFRANSDYTVNDRLRIGESFSISQQQVFRGVNAGGDGFLLRNAATMPPFFEIFDNDNSIANNRYGFDGNLDVGGLTVGNQNGINEIVDNMDRTTRLIGGLYAELDIVDGLTYRSAASLDLINARNDSWNPGYSADELGLDRSAQQAGDVRVETNTQVFTNTLTYSNTFGDHSFNLLGGIEYQKLRSTSLSVNVENFLSADPAFYTVIRNGQDNLRAGGGASESAFIGYIGRLSYDFQSKYLLTATLRRDGSSNFSPDGGRRWGTFPSFSAAWRVSEESFFDGSGLISDLKVRGSWGQLGNDQTTAFPHLFRVSTTPDYGLGGNSVQAPAPINFVNKDVTWETVETIDFGLDISLFDNKVDLLATYYRRETKDFLVTIPIPAITGFTAAPVNAGTVLNTGVEFELGYETEFKNGLGIAVSGNLTTVDNELTSLTPGLEEFLVTGQYRTAIGYPIGYFYGYETDGLYQTDSDVSAALPDALSPQGPRAGDVRFVDNNGPAGDDAAEGVIFSEQPDGEVDFNDRTYLGKTIPDFFYGLNLNLNYKNVDVSLFFQGVSGVQLYNAFRAGAESMVGSGRNQLTTTTDRWTGPNTSDHMPRAVATDPNSNNRFSDRWIEDGDYLRLKNIQVGYSVPQSLIQRSRGTLQGARIYVAATNLFTITNYSGLDPEVMTFRTNGSQIGSTNPGTPPIGGAGTDGGNIPQSRTLQLGVQLRF